MKNIANDRKVEVGTSNPNWQVPTVLLDTGFYAIELHRAEVYDEGNIMNIPHYIFYDRATGIAVDMTDEIAAAPGLSKTLPAAIISETEVNLLERLLTGSAELELKGRLGVKRFSAVEVEPGLAESLREPLNRLAMAKRAHEEAVRNFEDASAGLLRTFGVAPTSDQLAVNRMIIATQTPPGSVVVVHSGPFGAGITLGAFLEAASAKQRKSLEGAVLEVSPATRYGIVTKDVNGRSAATQTVWGEDYHFVVEVLPATTDLEALRAQRREVVKDWIREIGPEEYSRQVARELQPVSLTDGVVARVNLSKALNIPVGEL